MCVNPQRLDESNAPGTEVAVCCEPPVVGSGNYTHVLCKSNAHSFLTAEPSLQDSGSFQLGGMHASATAA